MAAQPKPLPVHEPSYLEGGGIVGWLTTIDHKRVAVMYLASALFFMAFGGLEAMAIRAQLWHPDNHVLSAATYNAFFTMHGTTMVFLVVMPLLLGFFGNFLIPLQIGARDVAFPRLNALSFWLALVAGILLHLGWIRGGLPDAGWFGYANLTERYFTPGLAIDWWVIGLLVSGTSTVLTGLNFLTTIIAMRAPGMTYMRMPMFMWSMLVTSILILIAFPALTIGLIFLLFDRFFDTHFYVASAGATPILWQHLFWLFGHPEVYIMALPAFGIISEVVPTFSRKPLFGYPMMAYSICLIAFLSYGVWGHHMFATGMGPVADSAFAITSMLIAIPTGVKIFSWIATVWGGSLRMTTAFYFALGMVLEFTIGGLSGIMHASAPIDLQQTDSYFVVAHFHYVLFGGVMFAIMAAFYYWWPKISGHMLGETARQVAFLADGRRIQSHIFPDALSRNVGDAAAHLHLRRGHGLDASQPAGDDWRFHSRHRVSAFLHQHFQKHCDRRTRACRSVGRPQPRMVDAVAAARVQLRDDPANPRSRCVVDSEVWARRLARRRRLHVGTGAVATAE